MPSTYTDSLGLEKQQTGENVNLWGQVLNNTIDLIDQALDGVANIPLTGSTASVTITNGQLSNGRCRLLYFSGSISAPCTVSLPPTTGKLTKLYWIVNSSGASVILQQLPGNGVAGAKVTVANGTSQAIYCDGLGNVGVLGSLSSTPGDFTVNGNEEVTGNLTVNGATITHAIQAAGDITCPNLTAANGVTAQNLTTSGDAHVNGNLFTNTIACTLLDYTNIACVAPFTNTVTLGTGAGTGAVLNKAGASDGCGQVVITTGTSPAGVGSPILTIAIVRGVTALNVVFSPMNAASADAKVYIEHDETPGNVVSSFTLYAGNTPLAASTAYAWSYIAIQ